MLVAIVALPISDRKKRLCCLGDSSRHMTKSKLDQRDGNAPCLNEDQASSPEIRADREATGGPYKVMAHHYVAGRMLHGAFVIVYGCSDGGH